LINLSLALCEESAQHDPELLKALDDAQASGAVIVAAAGNQGRLAAGQIVSHSVTIPVVAVDAADELVPDCNFGPAITHAGVAAPGHNVRGYGADGQITTMSGTSVATALATGILAKVWCAHPTLAGDELRAAVARLAPRGGSIPPVIDFDSISAALEQSAPLDDIAAHTDRRNGARNSKLRGEAIMMNANIGSTGHNRNVGSATTIARASVVPAHAVTGCACGGTGEACTCTNGNSSAQFVYVLGTVDIRVPDPSVAYELQRVGDTIGVVQGQGTYEFGDKKHEVEPDEDLRSWCYRIFSDPQGRQARYIARQLCWILTVEGVPGYYLRLNDPSEMDDLIHCLGQPSPRGRFPHRPDYDIRTGWYDLSLFVGSSSLVPSEICPGIEVPVLGVDYLCSYEQNLFESWMKPKHGNIPKSKGTRSEKNGTVGGDYLGTLLQSSDNFGDTDEWRALNYLAVQYSDLYRCYAERLSEGYSLDSVTVPSSRLSRQRGRRIVDPVFAFRKPDGATRRFFVRVDVSYLFPMLLSPLSEYVSKVDKGG
jgi:hypothetical protein